LNAWGDDANNRSTTYSYNAGDWLAAQVQRGARRVRRRNDLPLAFLKHSQLYPMR
jgi:hypothetical protein